MSEVFLFITWVVVALFCGGAYLSAGLAVSFSKDHEDKNGAELSKVILFWPWFVLSDLALFVVKRIKIEVAKWKK